MTSSFKVESGVQLLARLTRRPSLSQLLPALESNLPSGAVLEVSGTFGTGKSLLAADLACRALVPRRCGGCGAGVVVFSTDGNFNVDWLLTSVKHRVKESMIVEDYCNEELVESIFEGILPNLVISDVYDSLQLLVSIENLETILTENTNISLVIFDTLTAFYWSDQSAKLQRMDSYLKTLIKRIQKVTREFKVTVLYTRPDYFCSKQDGVENLEVCVKDPAFERVNCKIQLGKLVNDHSKKETFQATISTYNDSCVKNFSLSECKIIWYT